MNGEGTGLLAETQPSEAPEAPLEEAEVAPELMPGEGTGLLAETQPSEPLDEVLPELATGVGTGLLETQSSETPNLAEVTDVVPELENESPTPTETGAPRTLRPSPELQTGGRRTARALRELELTTITPSLGLRTRLICESLGTDRLSTRGAASSRCDVQRGDVLSTTWARIPPLGRIAALSVEGAPEPVFADVVAVGMQESTWSAAQARRASAGDFGGDEDDGDDDEADDPAAESAEPPDIEATGVCDSSKDGLLAALAATWARRTRSSRGSTGCRCGCSCLCEAHSTTKSRTQSAAENTGLGHVVANRRPARAIQSA